MSNNKSSVILDRHEVHVNGRTFGLSETAFKRIEHTVYPGTKQIMPIIDRDADIFAKYIWPHLLGYKLYLKDTDKDTLFRVLSDSEFYQLPELREQVAAALGSIALTAEELNAKVEDEYTKLKALLTSLGKLGGTIFGPYFGIDNFGDEFSEEVEELDADIHAAAQYTVENGSTEMNPYAKIFMVLAIKFYSKVLTARRQNVDPMPPEQEFVAMEFNPVFFQRYDLHEHGHDDNDEYANHDD